MIIIVIIIIMIIIIMIIIIIFIFLTSKVYNSVVNQKKLLIKFDEKQYWYKLLNISNISYKPWANLTWTSSATPVFLSFFE